MPALLTVKEYADIIRVHPLSVYRRIREHRQPGVYRFGRDIRIDLAAALTPAQKPVVAPTGRLPAFGGLYTSV
jgi:hypothetical protein